MRDDAKKAAEDWADSNWVPRLGETEHDVIRMAFLAGASWASERKDAEIAVLREAIRPECGCVLEGETCCACRPLAGTYRRAEAMLAVVAAARKLAKSLRHPDVGGSFECYSEEHETLELELAALDVGGGR